jgi:hypothetical protein
MMMRDNNDVGGPERGEYAMVEPQQWRAFLNTICVCGDSSSSLLVEDETPQTGLNLLNSTQACEPQP